MNNIPYKFDELLLWKLFIVPWRNSFFFLFVSPFISFWILDNIRYPILINYKEGRDRRIFTFRLREHYSFALFRELADCPFQRTRKLSRHLEGCSLAGKERARQRVIRERAGQRCFLVTASLQWTRFAGVANPTTMSADRFS